MGISSAQDTCTRSATEEVRTCTHRNKVKTHQKQPCSCAVLRFTYPEWDSSPGHIEELKENHGILWRVVRGRRKEVKDDDEKEEMCNCSTRNKTHRRRGTHTHTHTHTLTHTHTYTHSYSCSLTLAHSHSLTSTHSDALIHSLMHTPTVGIHKIILRR
jgi:hypothetical protein